MSKNKNPKQPADLKATKIANKHARKMKKLEIVSQKVENKAKNAKELQKTARTAARSTAATGAAAMANQTAQVREETRRMQIEADKEVQLAKNKAAVDWNSIIGLGEGGDSGASDTGSYGGKE